MIRSALAGFFGTYLSRYSDYNGYWLFGYLVRRIRAVEIDLLAAPLPRWRRGAMASATNLARTTFVDQIRKAGLDPLVVQEASLVIVRGSADHGFVNRRRVSGYHFTFELVAISDLGKRYGLKRQLWVAPHSGLREYRSVR